MDPSATFKNHLKVNNPPPNAHLFSHKHGKGMRPMTHLIFLNRIHKIVAERKMENLPGHGIRVGTTLEYLLRGIPFDVVKTKGRWKSEAFWSYL